MSSSASAPSPPFTIGDAAARLGICRGTLRAAIERGEVPAARIGRRWLVPAVVVERLSNGQPVAVSGGVS